ncbi:flavin reductase family protein [Acidipila sp. EB88]|nr:flavin reductase family protein [Acidipila sp. EB88]
MQSFDPQQLSPKDNYKLLAGAVVPRPIAWVSTVDEAGVYNLAPYSFFTVASANPPIVCFCPSVREAKDGLLASKDTLRNIVATGEFVVNIVSEASVEAMNETAAQVEPGVDEFALAGLAVEPGEVVRAPRVAGARVQMECRLREIVVASALPGGGSIVLGEVVRFHVSEQVLEGELHIAPEKLEAVGRMAGGTYVRTTDRFELERPK